MSLDDALAAWAATIRLPEATAADIYQRIVMTPVPDVTRRLPGNPPRESTRAGGASSPPSSPPG